MLHIILGPAAGGKTRLLFEAIRQCTEKGQQNAILIVPEQYSHEAERELVATIGAKASLHAEVRSFTRLASRVFDELGNPGGVPLDEGGRMLTMRMALTAVSDQLKLYGKLGRKPEFLKGLLDTIDELKQCGITPETLHDAAPWAEGALGEKLRELAFLYGAYDGISGKRDPRDILTRLSDQIAASEVTKCAVFVDAFSDFTAVEGRILQKLLQKGTDITIALTANDLHDQSPLFAPVVETASRLKRWAEESGEAIKITKCTAESTRPIELQAVCTHLFANSVPSPIEQADPAVELYTAKTRLEECELAAARVRKLVMDEGYRYREIAVTARGFQDYETVAEEVFARYEIPVSIARKSSILEKPILLLLTAALDILEGGWRFEAVFRYLRTGLAGITQREVDVLEEYVRRWNLYGTAWTKQADWSENPAGYGAEFGERERAKLEAINALRRRVTKALIALSEAGKRASTAKEQGAALYDFLEEIELPQTLTKKAERFRLSGRETLAAEYSQIWDILMNALEQAHEILGDTPMTQTEFTTLMRLTLGQYSVGSIPQTIDRVQLGDLDRTRRRGQRCLIVLGATDTRLPTPGTSRGVITDAERDRLEELGLTLSETAEEGVYREQALIYHAFSAPQERLIAACPESEGDGAPSRPSAVFKRLEEIVGREAMPVSALGTSFRQNAPAPAFDLALQAELGRSEDRTAMQAAAYFANDPRLQALKNRSKTEGECLTKPITDRLYGRKLRLSASRIETFGACAFRYFMQYGLRAQGRRNAELDAPMAGDFMHFVLEKVTRQIQSQGGFHKVAVSEWKPITEQAVATYIDERLSDITKKSKRFQYLFKRLVRETEQVVEDMVAELGKSDFVPCDFELAFGEPAGTLPPVELTDGEVEISLQGVVDRVDGWLHDGKLYLRVVDYKTGRRAFSLSDVWYGVGVQMLLYLFALTKLGGEQYGDIPIEPGGVLYTPARDVIVSAPKNATKEEVETKRRKALIRSGLVLRDPDLIQAMERGEKHEFIPVKLNKAGNYEGDALVSAEELGRLSRHIDQTLLALAHEMKAGKTAPNPHTGSVMQPCQYCDYRLACQHDAKKDGGRYLEALSKQQVLDNLLQEG